MKLIEKKPKGTFYPDNATTIYGETVDKNTQNGLS